MRLEQSDASEMVSQVLYGELFKVLEFRKKWSKIRLSNDGYEGWIDNKQYKEITESEFKNLDDKEIQSYLQDPISIVNHQDGSISNLLMGSQLSSASFLNDSVTDIEYYQFNQPSSKKSILDNALNFINTPYLWGGRSFVGIDCSGFTQLAYRLSGYHLSRDASEQAGHGEILSFIEESEPGDLAFFDNTDGIITHVGIIMENNYIIHAHGKVRIDRLDQTGIFNLDTKLHSHKLRMIKSIL